MKRLQGLIAPLMMLAALLGIKPHQAPPAPASPIPGHAVYVPGPQNSFVPKPSCATLVDPKKKAPPWTRWFAFCATTHGPIIRGPFPKGYQARHSANEIYDAELKAQGGVLLQ